MSTPLILAGPLDDPEAQVPTTDAQVARTLDDATVAAAAAQVAWRRLLEALEGGESADQVQRDFERAFAELVLRWGFFHGAARDRARAA